MINRFAPTGATYLSKGLIFVVLSINTDENWTGELVARCLLLDDHPSYTKRISPGTVMEVESWTSIWEEAIELASLPEQGKVAT